jgi:uncharacterized protein (TIGR00369 family)
MAPRRLQENMDRLARGEEWVPPPGAVNMIGFRPVAMEVGRAVVELVPDERHVTPRDPNAVFGGYLACIADVAISFAYATTLEEGDSSVTLDLKIDFLRSARRGVALHAEGCLRKGGKTTGFATCEIKDADGHLVAYATGTCLRIVPRR